MSLQAYLRPQYLLIGLTFVCICLGELLTGFSLLLLCKVLGPTVDDTPYWTHNTEWKFADEISWVHLQMLLKCADIGHLAADQETHKRWAFQLEEEFFQQVTLSHHTLQVFLSMLLLSLPYFCKTNSPPVHLCRLWAVVALVHAL